MQSKNMDVEFHIGPLARYMLSKGTFSIYGSRPFSEMLIHLWIFCSFLNENERQDESTLHGFEQLFLYLLK